VSLQITQPDSPGLPPDMINIPDAPLIPNKADIAAHLYALFDPAFVLPYPDAWIEIAFGRPDGTGNFPAFDLQEAVDFAVEKNAAGFNVYVGAALRHGDGSDSGRANGDNVLDASHAWAEYDGPGDDERIQAVLKANNLTPAMVVTTGTTPYLRRHLNFQLDGAVTPERLEAANTALCRLLGSDAVQDAPRVLRLGGTINYPSPDKVGRGYVAELTTLHEDKDARAFKVDELIGLAPSGDASNPFIVHGEEHGGLPVGRNDAELMALLQSINGKDGGKEKWRNPMIRAVGSMVGHGWPDTAIKFACAPYCDDGIDDADLKKIIEDQRKDFEKPNVELQDTAEPKPGELPVIEIKDGQLSALATRAEQMLIAAGVPIYQRGGMLMRPIIETVDASRGRKTKVAQLRVLDSVYLRDLMATYAKWIKYDARKKTNVLTNPPNETAATVLARAGDWTFLRIVGVISTPTMRPDGSLLMTKGYDEVTGLLLVEPPPMPVIPDKPSREDALAALALIEGLIVGFPFVSDVDRAVALSAIITPVVRGAFPVTPMHASRAPTAGSGKSFLWDIVAAIAIGQLMPVMSTGPDVNQMDKRLGAAMMTGQPLISIDNISSDLGGDTLCQIIERPVVEIRILGRSENVKIEARGTSTYSTGNNFVVVGDLCRRVLTVNLDAAMERPELRQFDFDPIARILADRGTYIAACLTICRAYLVAGRPGLAPRLASFEGYSDVVGSALIWLGREDVVKSMEAARAEDPERAELSDMLESWARVIGLEGDNRAKLADVIIRGMAVVRPAIVDYENPNIMEPKHPEFYAALEAIAFKATGKRGQKPDGKMLGDWVRRFRGRVINGKRFAYLANDKRGAEWWVEGV
jgi:hypothetical protein